MRLGRNDSRGGVAAVGLLGRARGALARARGRLAAWSGPLLLAAAVWLGLFHRLGSVPLFDVDEGAFGEATREMLARGDYVSTWLNGQPRFDKPILTYWLQAASVGLFGFTEFALRLPSALAACGWIGAIHAFTRRAVDGGTARAAAFIAATSAGVVVIGRGATADALLNLFLALAMFDVYRELVDPRPRWPASLRSPWAWLPPAVALALVAGILATGGNRALFLRLNHGGQAIADPVWFHLTMLGDGAVALALVLPWIRRAPRLFWAALLAAAVAGLWTQVTKQLIDVPRPLTVFAGTEFHQAGPAYRRVSFPSGHAAAAFALAGICVMGIDGRRLWRGGMLLLACLVGLSRIMVGVHWPLDVLWGMLGGWLGAWTGLALQARRRWRTAGVGGMVAGAVLLADAASLLVSRHIGIPAVLPAQRVLAAVCLVCGAWQVGGLARTAVADRMRGAASHPARAPPWRAAFARVAWRLRAAWAWRRGGRPAVVRLVRLVRRDQGRGDDG